MGNAIDSVMTICQGVVTDNTPVVLMIVGGLVLIGLGKVLLRKITKA